MIGAIGEFPIGGFNIADSLSVADPLPGLLSDPSTERSILLRSTPSNVPVDVSSSGYTSLPTDSEYKTFHPSLAKPYNFTVEIPEGSGSDNAAPFSGGANLGVGEIRIKNSDAELDSIAGLDWLGPQIDLYLGPKRGSLGNFSRFSKSTASGLTWDLDNINILHRDFRFRLQKPLQNERYMGVGQCLRFAGAFDCGVSYGNILNKTSTDSFTAQILIRSTSSGFIFSKGGEGSGAGWSAKLSIFGQLVMQISDGVNTTSGNGLGVFNDYRLRRVTLVVDRALQQARLYMSNPLTQELSLEKTLDISAIGNLTNAAVLRTACAGNGFVGLTGDVDDFRMWNRALTVDEIKKHMHKEIFAQAGLDLYSKYNEGSGTTASDSSGNSRTGTISGGTWIGSLEGDASLEGTPKPIALGVRKNVVAKLVDPIRRIYQWHSRIGQSLDEVTDKGDPIVFGSEVSDILASTPSAGTYTVSRTATGSYFRMGSNAIGTILCSFKGDASGALGYVTSAARIHEKVLKEFVSGVEIDQLSYNQLHTSASAVTGFYFDEDIYIDAALDEISKKGNSSWWAPGRTGIISVGRVENPSTVVASIELNKSNLIEPSKGGKYTRTPVGVRVGQIILGYQPYDETLTGDQVATIVSQTKKLDLAESYRFVTATDPNRSADSDTITILTNIDSKEAAQAEADRLLEIWKVDRAVYTVSPDQSILEYFVGTGFNININRYDTGFGKKGIAMKIYEDFGEYGQSEKVEMGILV